MSPSISKKILKGDFLLHSDKRPHACRPYFYKLSLGTLNFYKMSLTVSDRDKEKGIKGLLLVLIIIKCFL